MATGSSFVKVFVSMETVMATGSSFVKVFASVETVMATGSSFVKMLRVLLIILAKFCWPTSWKYLAWQHYYGNLSTKTLPKI